MLIPNKSIYVLQGQSGEVTCEAEGPSVSTLKWEKQQDDKSYAAVPKSQVNVTKDSKYVRVTVKITNAQFADSGIYKCTVSVPPNKSDYKVTAIKVKGRFVCFCLFVYTLVGVYCPVRKNCLIFIHPCILASSAARLAQLGERRSAEREVASSNPGRTNTQGLKNN